MSVYFSSAHRPTMARLFVLLSLACLPALPALAPVQGVFERMRFDRYANSQSLGRVVWSPEPPSAQLGVAFFEWLHQLERAGERARPDERSASAASVLVTPRLSLKQATALATIPSASLVPLHLPLQPLPESSPSSGVLWVGVGEGVGVGGEGRGTGEASPSPLAAPDVDAATVERAMRAWVRSALSTEGLGLCPFTQNDRIAAVGLQGVKAAPILHVTSQATTLSALLVDCFRAILKMVEGGEDGYSSIILSAPAWDSEWDAWRDAVFPMLEASVLATDLGRTLGVVCFHPHYSTPDPAFLARHRFGHMHSIDTLRSWTEAEAPELSGRLDDTRLAEAANQMRRAPHAMVNVLWSRQLEAAETKRKSSELYVRNLERILEGGGE